jgi:MFS family permease
LRGLTRTTFSALGVRNFKLFFTGQLISQVGNWITSIALVLLVLHKTRSGLALGLLTVCQFGPILLLGPFAGLMADRSDKRRLLIITQALEMLQSFALAALAFTRNAPLPAFYVAALAGGVLLAFDTPVRRAFVVELVPEEQVQNAVTLHSALMTGSRVIGPAIAGALVTTAGFGWCFAIDGVTYLAVLYCLWRMRPAELRRPPATQRGGGQVRAGLSYVRRVPELWVVLVMMTAVGTLAFNFPVVLPLFVERTFRGSDATFTLFYSVISVGSLAGALAATHRRSVTIATIARTSAAFGGTMLLLAASPNLATSFPIALLLGAASVSFMTLSTALIQLRSDPAMRGRVVALQSMVMLGSAPIGGPLVGAVCDWFGARGGLVVGGLAAVGAAIWGHVAGRNLDPTRRAQVDTQPGPPADVSAI